MTVWAVTLLFAALALAAIVSRNLVRRIVALGVLLVAIAGAYLQLEAPLLATVQLLLYAGGITVLFGFSIGTTGGKGEGGVSDLPRPFLGLIVAAATIATGLRLSPLPVARGLPVDIDAARLIVERPIAFEGIGLVLLSAVIAALALVRARSEP